MHDNGKRERLLLYSVRESRASVVGLDCFSSCFFHAFAIYIAVFVEHLCTPLE